MLVSKFNVEPTKVSEPSNPDQRVITIRAPKEEVELWENTAKEDSRSLNNWVRVTLTNIALSVKDAKDILINKALS